MSKERELLQRALEGLENRKDEVADWGAYASEYFQTKWGYEASITAYDSLIEEISAHLAAEEGKRKEEPFSIIQSGCIRGLQLSGKPYPRTCPACGLGPCKISHTPAPSAEKRKPLKTEELEKKYMFDSSITSWIPFKKGVRWAEKMHKIGGGDE